MVVQFSGGVVVREGRTIPSNYYQLSLTLNTAAATILEYNNLYATFFSVTPAVSAHDTPYARAAAHWFGVT